MTRKVIDFKNVVQNVLNFQHLNVMMTIDHSVSCHVTNILLSMLVYGLLNFPTMSPKVPTISPKVCQPVVAGVLLLIDSILNC